MSEPIYETTVTRFRDGLPVKGCDGDAIAERDAALKRVEELERALMKIRYATNFDNAVGQLRKIEGIAREALAHYELETQHDRGGQSAP